MRKRIVRLSGITAVLAALAIVVLSCSGGGGGESGSCADPLAITPGTWCITIQSTQNTCNAPLIGIPYPAEFTQNYSSLTASTENGFTYDGTICGYAATLTGNNDGIITTMHMTFSDASTAAGTVDWDTGSCTGTDTYIAVAGACAAVPLPPSTP